jgi:hypothetical protein
VLTAAGALGQASKPVEALAGLILVIVVTDEIFIL